MLLPCRFQLCNGTFIVGPGAYLAPAKPSLALFPVEGETQMTLVFSEIHLMPGKVHIHSFIHLTDTMDIYSARRCAVCYRNETAVRVLAQTGDTAIAWTPACPAPASASCGTLGSKPSEHLFPQL